MIFMKSKFYMPKSKFSSPKADKNLKLSIVFLTDIHNFTPAVIPSPWKVD
jgi:hypothetical protein